ncbi:MAG: DUF1963 domain-containing protein [Anaerovoracaceae bacterium]|jgi:uncharacterized protein YwqG
MGDDVWGTIMEVDPDDDELLVRQNLGAQLIGEEKYQGAIELLLDMAGGLSRTERAFEQQAVFYYLGDVYQRVEDNEQALKYLQISAAVEKYKGDAFTDMGIILKNEGNYQGASECFRKALLAQWNGGTEVFDDHDPVNVWHYLAVSQMYAYKEEGSPPIREILYALGEVLFLSKDYYDAYRNIAICLDRLSGGGLGGRLSRVGRLARRFDKVAKDRQITDGEYGELLTLLIDCVADEHQENLHFKPLINHSESSDVAPPTFHMLRQELHSLWKNGETGGSLVLFPAFGQFQELLGITKKVGKDGEKVWLYMEAKGYDGEALCREVFDLTLAEKILQRYFYYHEVEDQGSWQTKEEYHRVDREDRLATLESQILEPFREETNVPYNQITLKKLPCGRLDSKVGGEPYMPEDVQWPRDQGGTPLRLLAQINFAQMPGLSLFPQKGILQFFIMEQEEDLGAMYGLDFDDPMKQNGFRLIYHEEVDPQAPQQEVPRECFNESYGLLNKEDCLKMEFTSSVMAMTIDDYRFERRFLPLYNEAYNKDVVGFYDMDDQVSDHLYDVLFQTGHRISGYPYFTQTDPRGRQDDEDKNILLFQLDSDEIEDVSLMWGDVGVGNFFISEEDLLNCDFSKVLYNWDCG